MKYTPLSREEINRVINGQGNAARVPMLFNFWLYPESFGEEAHKVEEIIAPYPDDVNLIKLNFPTVYWPPKDDPSYRWSYMDAPENITALIRMAVLRIGMNSWINCLPISPARNISIPTPSTRFSGR